MTTLELEHALEAAGESCPACHSAYVGLTWAQRDLRATARRCANRDTPRNRAAVIEAKAKRDREAEHAREHLEVAHS